MKYLSGQIFCLVLLNVLTLRVLAQAATEESDFHSPIQVIGAHLDGRLDGTPNAGYSRLIRKLMPQDQSVAVYQRYPLVRALRHFEDVERSCLFPASIKATVSLTSVPADALEESAAIDYVSSHVMTKKGRPVINNEVDIYGRTLAVQRGVEIVALVADADRFTVIHTPDDATALRMVAAGRVDGMYGWIPDVLIIASNKGIELPDFNPDFILFETTTHVVCKRNIGVQPLLDHINQRIATFRQSGQLGEILGPFARLTAE